MRAAVFLSALLLGVIGVALLSYVGPSGRPFAWDGAQPVALDSFYPDRIWAAKIAHARETPRYDLGLFGNSRSIMVAAGDIDLPCRFFNFSMPGESFRNSVEMLEALGRHHRAPAIAVISLDNFELQYMGHPEFPPLGLRLRRAFLDLGFVPSEGTLSARDAARLSWRHVLVTWLRVKEMFTADYVIAALGRALRLDWQPAPVPVGSAGGYLLDGSRSVAPRARGEDLGLVPRPPSHSVIPGLLRHDLARLAALRQRGLVDRVMVYESPLSPGNAERLLADPTPLAAADRAAFLATCHALLLDCRPATSLDAAASDWTNADHPPAGALGTMVRGSVTDSGGCGA
ncbi:MAG: hypothetical protein EXQ96_07000 [Alphaproteobacteria bacterium]|nr:hypothetical protein [Alphaproteobacteria bacterium]